MRAAVVFMPHAIFRVLTLTVLQIVFAHSHAYNLNPIMYRGEEHKLSSGHVRIQIDVNKTWMDLPAR